MATTTIKLVALHPGQRRIQAEARRFNAVACGRRFGKTKYGIRLLVEPALQGYPVAWFAPTNKMMIEVWRETLKRVQPILKSKNASEHRIELITGGVIEMWSLENYDSIRGRKYKRAIVDEAAMVKHLGDAWQAVIRPTLTDYRGDAFLLSTPKGRNFFWQCWVRGQDPTQTDWQSWQMPTSTNPFIDPSEVEAMRQELPERTFQQEVLALFLEDAGGVFRKVRQAATAPIVEPYAGDFVMGVDWGQSNDFTVLSVLDARTHKMVDLDRFNQIGWEVQRDRLKAMAKKWKARAIVAERNSIGGPNIEALQADGLPVVGFDTTAQSKGPLIQSLALAFEQSAIEIFNDPVLLAELEAYEGTRNPETGRWKYGAPEGSHDDVVMSLALAFYAIGVTPDVVANLFYADKDPHQAPSAFGVW